MSQQLAASQAADAELRRWDAMYLNEPPPPLELGKWVDSGRYWLPCARAMGGEPYTPSWRPPSPDFFKVLTAPIKYQKVSTPEGKRDEAASSASGNLGLSTAEQLVAEKEKIRARAAAIDQYLEEQDNAYNNAILMDALNEHVGNKVQGEMGGRLYTSDAADA